MASISRTGARHLAYAALTVTLSAAPSAAQTAAHGDASALGRAVKPGDTVAVTRWSGAKVKGQVVEATDCSLVIQRAGKALDVPSAAIKAIRRYPPPKRNPGAKGLLAFAETCDAIDCAPAALAVGGLAALFQGVDHLGRQPRIVYTARVAGSAGACAANQAGDSARDATPSITNARTVAVVGKTGRLLMSRGWASPNGDRAKQKVRAVLGAWGRYQIVDGAEAADLLIVVTEYQKNINLLKRANLIAELKVYRGGADVTADSPALWSGEAAEDFKKLPATKVAEEFAST